MKIRGWPRASTLPRRERRSARAGSAKLFGVDAWREPVSAHRRLAYVAGEPLLWPGMTGAETFELLAIGGAGAAGGLALPRGRDLVPAW